MKNQKRLLVCTLAVLCVLVQAQPAFAQQTILAESEQKDAGLPRDETREGEPSDGIKPEDDTQEDETSDSPKPEDDTSGDETKDDTKPEDEATNGAESDDETKPEDGETPEDDTTEEQEPEEPVRQPDKVSGLRTTCQSDTKVLLEWDASEGAAFYKVYRAVGNDAYKILGETKHTAYTDKSATSGKTYKYKVLPYNAKKKRGEGATVHLNRTQAVNIKTQKYTYLQMQTDMQQLSKQYSDYCRLTAIGKSVQGRTIYDFAIGSPNAAESLLVVSTLHAREYICCTVLMRELEYYLSHYNKSVGGSKPADVLKNMQIHYIVMSNPDGVTISQTKNARWKSNARGVDLNRNFPAKPFNIGGQRGSSGYSGKKALSEPETQAIAALTKKLKSQQKLRGVVNYHAMGQIVFGDCSDKKLKSATQRMYQITRQLTGYRDAGGYSSGNSKPIGGAYREYVMDFLGIPSITIEVGSTIAPCSYWEYNSAFQKNKLVVLKIAEALR